MEDLTKIKGVTGCAAYSGNNLVAGTNYGSLGDRAAEIEQFWATAASVIAANLKLGPAKVMLIRGKARQVLMILGEKQNIVCELIPEADWKTVAAEVRKRL